MTPSSSATSQPGLRKAAVFLMGVGDQVSAEILRHLTPDEVRRITHEIAATDSVGSAQMISVFREFESLTTEGRFFAKGGADCARRLLESAFGEESAHKLLAGPELGQQPLTPGGLDGAPPEQLASFLKAEHPQTIAVVLAGLSPQTAGGVLKSLPSEIQAQVAMRMASLDRVSPEAFRKVTDAIGGKLRNTPQGNKVDGGRALASVLNHVPPEQAEAILTAMGAQNPPVADSVRALMFVFDDILRIDDQGMKALTAGIDRKVLTVALKGCSVDMRGHFTKCMSQRAGEMLAEDMEALGPVRIRDVEAAQTQLIAAVRRLQESGAISTSSAGTDDYVV